MFARRTLLGAAACASALLVDGVQALVKGHDLSSVAVMEKEQGTVWYNTAGKQAAIEDILGAGGMDSVRLRIWTGEEYALNYTLPLAQRFSKAGYKIFLDMHFSDTWAQPSDQQTPSAWDASSVDTLAKACREHVSSTLKAFTEGGVELDILSIGNEITNGFLYPTGKIGKDFGPFAKLWKAARDGVSDAVAAGTKQPKIMIHLDNGWESEVVSWFFKGLFAEGTVTTDDVDVFGFSYYPYYNVNATLKALTESLTQMANTYKKPIYVAETDWPTNCTTVTLSEKFAVSARGQREWVMAIMDVLEGLPNGLGAGIFYWEPGYISVPGLGSACGSNLLFSVNWDNWPDTYAKALSSVYMFAEEGSGQGSNAQQSQSTPTATPGATPAPQTQTDSSQQKQINFSQLNQSSSGSSRQSDGSSTPQTAENPVQQTEDDSVVQQQ
ncbi:putative beta-galactosidase [Phytophthora sojae]|uniref:arabinogalactan endo-beta-1,4-galactanase n=1 Tax=Phytophthora sojae (strain P6497) TaxID=1094619 RepID=G4Z738_PHYSP|nr:putative beta-galactosidase [Phytophthora sojae]EGZ21790.1 putative beta-galactosidase [Phytophthora sojae]|eukprot:XP_009524507.1 putative beta-galactosidase [Phytophthora sojae]